MVDTLKGVYSPDLFHHRPPEGYLYTGTWHGNEGPTNGREVVFFFTAGNHPKWTKGKLLDHSTSFVVTNGKLVYASTSFTERREYTLEEFEKAIREIVRKEYVEQVQRKVRENG